MPQRRLGWRSPSAQKELFQYSIQQAIAVARVRRRTRRELGHSGRGSQRSHYCHIGLHESGDGVVVRQVHRHPYAIARKPLARGVVKIALAAELA
jgi:hypothetical protein